MGTLLVTFISILRRLDNPNPVGSQYNLNTNLPDFYSLPQMIFPQSLWCTHAYRLYLQYAHLYTMQFEHVAIQEAGKVVENRRP